MDIVKGWDFGTPGDIYVRICDMHLRPCMIATHYELILVLVVAS